MPARPRRFGAASYHAAMTATAPTVASLLTQARTRIDPVDADYLLLHVLHQSRSWLFAHASDAVSPTDAARFDALVQRRVSGEPVAYLTGSRGFWTLDLAVTPATSSGEYHSWLCAFTACVKRASVAWSRQGGGTVHWPLAVGWQLSG